MNLPRIRSHELNAHVGQRVRVSGWLHARRTLGRVTFLILRDGWGLIQIVVTQPQALTPLEHANALPESTLEVEATVVEQPRLAAGVELTAPQIKVLSAVTEPVPVVINKPTIHAEQATILEHAALTLRHPARRAISRLSSAAMAGFRQTLVAEGFTEIQTPKIVASATEGGANVFPVAYFGRSAYLAQSPQFYKQTMVGVHERVFEVGPVFRAEPHATARHLSTYVSMDVEMGFIENHQTVMRTLRHVLAGIMAHLKAHAAEALALLKLTPPEVPQTIPQIHFAEARRLLSEHTEAPLNAEDLSPAEERWLGEWAQRVHGSAFLFVTGYPMAKRPFYTHPEPGATSWSNSFDLLFRGTELVTGGQRLHRHQDITRALRQAKLSPEPFEGYLEAFRCGMPPHGGFAIGLERLIMQLTGTPNIRQVTLFPRDIARLTP